MVNGKKTSSKLPKFAKIYLITPNLLNNTFYKNLPKILKTKKISFLQIRSKIYSKKKLILHIKKIIKISKKFKTRLILNDDAELANKMGIGFHLGQNDLRNTNIAHLHKKKFGITCHNSLILVKKALTYKPAYIALGAFEKSKTKKVKFRASLKLLKNAKKLFRIPIVAIGGINNKNYKDIIKSGANYVAISSYVWKNKKLSPLDSINQFK